MEVARRQGSAVVELWMDGSSLPWLLPSFYIGLGRCPRPLETASIPSLSLKKSSGKNGGQNASFSAVTTIYTGKLYGLRSYSCSRPYRLRPYSWSSNFQYFDCFGRHFFIRTPIEVFLGSLDSYGWGLQHHGLRSLFWEVGKIHFFQHLKWLSLVPVAPPYYALFAPFAFVLSIIITNTYTHIKDKKRDKILPKLLNVQSSYENEWELEVMHIRHSCS